MPSMTWKSELEKRVAIIEEFLRFHKENKECNEIHNPLPFFIFYMALEKE